MLNKFIVIKLFNTDKQKISKQVFADFQAVKFQK